MISSLFTGCIMAKFVMGGVICVAHVATPECNKEWVRLKRREDIKLIIEFKPNNFNKGMLGAADGYHSRVGEHVVEAGGKHAEKVSQASARMQDVLFSGQDGKAITLNLKQKNTIMDTDIFGIIDRNHKRYSGVWLRDKRGVHVENITPISMEA